MEELFLETQDGNVKIDQGMVNKYKLKKGTLSPFNRHRIVDKDGDFTFEVAEEIRPVKVTKESEDGIVELDNGLSLSTSEILEISEGADSSVEDTWETNRPE